MTVAVSLAQTVALGDGTTTAFGFSFIGAVAADIVVSVTDTSGTVTVLDPSLYTIVLNAADPGQLWGVGGTVTYPLSGSPLPVGATITMTRSLPYVQEIPISNQGAFYPDAVEEALDLLDMQIQQLAQLIQSGTGSASGTVVGPAASSNYGVAYFVGTNGLRIASTAAGPTGYVLTGNGTTTPPNFQVLPGQANGVLEVTVYTPGDYTITPPTGATMGVMTLIGGGGGGQGAAGNPGAGKVAIGSGGSGGGWAEFLFTAASANGASLHVGDRGVGGVAGNNAGANGDKSTFLGVTASGGLGGILGTTSSSPPVAANSMAGGTVSGSSLSSQRPGGASGADLTTSTSAAFGGHGGDSRLSPGTAPATCGTDSQADGPDATGYGGGGGGGVASGSGTSASGGDGSSGSATIVWYGFAAPETGATNEATQAQQEAGILGTVYVSPRVQRYHDSAAKAVAVVAADGTLEFGYNIASVDKGGSGQYTINFTTAFATTSYGVNVSVENAGPGEPAYWSKTTGSVSLNIAVGHTPDEGDKPFTVTCWGRLAASSGYVAGAVHTDGTTALTTASALSGVANGRSFTLSFWTRNSLTVPPTLKSLLGDDANYVDFSILSNSSYSLLPSVWSSGFASGFQYWTDASQFTINDGNWHWVGIAVDTNAAAGNKICSAWIDGTNVTPGHVSDTGPAFDINWTGAAPFKVLLSDNGNTDPYVGDFADFWFAPNQFVDFSIQANRELFRSAAGKPVYLGASGELPTGTQPSIFLTGDATTFGTNVGTGGTLALTGSALTNASSSPSD